MIEPARVFRLPADLEGHLVYEPEGSPIGRPRDADLGGIEPAERIRRQTLVEQRRLDGPDDVFAERS